MGGHISESSPIKRVRFRRWSIRLVSQIRSWNDCSATATVAYRFRFLSLSKQQLMEGLAVAIQQHRVTFPEGVLTSELEALDFR